MTACSDPPQPSKRSTSSAASASSTATGPTESTLQPVVEDLRDIAKRDAAIKRLTQAYADAFAADKGKTPQPNLERILNTIVDPLTRTCIEGNLSASVRNNLVKLLADTHDQRANPCLHKALEDYKPDSDGEDVTNVLAAIVETKDKGALPLLMGLLQRFEFAQTKAKPLGQRLLAALRAVVDPSVEDQLVTMVAAPMPDPSSGEMKDVTNQAFWQMCAATLLGDLRSQKAVRPLLKAILSPPKAPLAVTALVSLVKIGAPSIAPTVALLRGDDTELVQYSESEQLKLAGPNPSDAVKKSARRAHVSVAAEILGNIGTASCGDEILAAMTSAEPLDRTILALSLTRVPRSPPIVDAYKKAVEDTPLGIELPSGSAKEQLVSRLSDFTDPTLVPWLLAYVKTVKAPPDDLGPLLQSTLIAAIKLMTADQVKDVEAFGKLEIEGAAIASSFLSQLDQSKTLVTKCLSVLNCYVEALKNPDHQQKDKEFVAIKALHMIGALGDDSTRDVLVDLLPSLSSVAVRATALLIIERLTPRDGKKVAAKLRGFNEQAIASKDAEKSQLSQVFLQTAARLDNR